MRVVQSARHAEPAREDCGFDPMLFVSGVIAAGPVPAVRWDLDDVAFWRKSVIAFEPRGVRKGVTAVLALKGCEPTARLPNHV